MRSAVLRPASLAAVAVACCSLAGAQGAQAAGSGVPLGGLVLSQTVQTYWPQGPADAAAGLVIGDRISVDAVLTNTGTQPAAATLDFTMAPAKAGDEAKWTLGFPGTFSFPSACAFTAPDDGSIHCVGSIDPGGRWDVFTIVTAAAPGTLDTLAQGSNLTTPASGSLDWATRVRCDINGTSGNDVLTATGTQSVCGDAGHDILIAASSSARLFGGDGTDTFRLGQGGGYVDGGPGMDTVSFANAPNPELVCPDGPHQYFSGGMAPPTKGGTNMRYIETIVGTRYADRLQGGFGMNTIRGRGGNDIINGGLGTDTLVGGKGNDRIYALDGYTDTVVGGRGTDRTLADRSDHILSATRTPLPRLSPCSG